MVKGLKNNNTSNNNNYIWRTWAHLTCLPGCCDWLTHLTLTHLSTVVGVLIGSLSHLSLQKNELKSVPYLQLVEGQVSVTPDAARQRRPRSGRQSSLKSSRESSRCECVSQQLHYVSRDTSVNGTPDVTQCDVTHTAAAAASSSAEDNGLYVFDYIMKPARNFEKCRGFVGILLVITKCIALLHAYGVISAVCLYSNCADLPLTNHSLVFLLEWCAYLRLLATAWVSRRLVHIWFIM